MKDDGTMARVPDLIEFCRTHEMKMLTVAELIRYRMQHERYVHRVGEAMVETKHGEFRLIAYESEVDGGDSHMALIRGDISDSSAPVLVRMHAHCLLGDVFGATGCDCNATLEGSLQAIAEKRRGALIYLHQTSKGFTAEKDWRAVVPDLPPGTPFADAARKRAQDPSRNRPGSSDPFRSESEAHPPADQSPKKGRRAGRIRYRNSGAGSGEAISSQELAVETRLAAYQAVGRLLAAKRLQERQDSYILHVVEAGAKDSYQGKIGLSDGNTIFARSDSPFRGGRSEHEARPRTVSVA